MMNRGKLFIAKNRAGQDGLVLPVIMNTVTAKLEILPPIDIDINAEFSIDASIKEQYNKYNKRVSNGEIK